MELHEKIFEAVDGLGTTADEIAANLEREGIKGTPAMHDRCPISAYITKHWPQAKPSTGYRALVLHGDTSSVHRMPPQHGEFITRFDRGAYPHLQES